MRTLRAPFRGMILLDTLHSILTDPVPPLPTPAGQPGYTTLELQRVIAKCTAKDADERFQGMKDVIVDLRAARRRLESASGVSSTVMPAPSALSAGVSQSRRKPLLIAAGLALVAIVGRSEERR